MEQIISFTKKYRKCYQSVGVLLCHNAINQGFLTSALPAFWTWQFCAVLRYPTHALLEVQYKHGLYPLKAPQVVKMKN